MPSLAFDLMGALPELRANVFSFLEPKDIATMPAVSKLWRAYVVHHLTTILHMSAPLRSLIAPAGRPRLRLLQSCPLILTCGGYDSSFNDHEWCEMADDGPGCARSSEVVCTLPHAERPWYTPPPAWMRQMPDLAARRADHIVLSDDPSTVYAIGGREGATALASVEVLNLTRWQLSGEGWQSHRPMSTPRYGHVGCRLAGHHLLVAGGGETAESRRSVERLDLAQPSGAPEWVAMDPMPRERFFACSAVLHDRWYVLGGDFGAARKVDSYDLERGWSPHKYPSLGSGRFSAAATTYRGCVICLGGLIHGHQQLGAAEWWDPRDSIGWRSLPNMTKRIGHTQGMAAVVNEDTLFLIGGMLG